MSDAEFNRIMSQYYGHTQWMTSWEVGTKDAVVLLKFLNCFRGIPNRCRQDPWIDEKLHVAAEDNVAACNSASPNDAEMTMTINSRKSLQRQMLWSSLLTK